jgi:site-specific DNA recombinase
MQFVNVAAYARYSTENQDENSIETQFDNIAQYCQAHQYNIVAHYFDKAKSGTNIERADFQEMISAARAGKFSAIVIYDITRGSRDVADWFTFRKQMMQAGVQIISTHDNIGDLLNPNDFLTELIGVGIGQHHVLTSRLKSIDGTTMKAHEAIFLGGCPPLGYDVKDGKYIINESEAKIVRKIFSMYASGESYSNIIDSLNGAIGKKGRPIGKNSLSSILRNDRYIGIYTWNRRKIKIMGKWAGGVPNERIVQIKDAIPRIIDQPTWERVQIRLKSKTNSSSKATRSYLLTGKIVCAECGARYCGRTSVNQRGYQNPYYVCGNKTRTRQCHSKNIKCEDLDNFCRNAVREYILNYDLSETAQRVVTTYNATVSQYTNEKKELAEISRKIKNGTDAILNGFSSEELFQQMGKLQMRQKELEKIIADDAADELDLDLVTKLLKNMLEDVSTNIDEVVKQFVTKIYAHPNGDCTVHLGVAHFTSSGREIRTLDTTGMNRML